MNLKNLKVIFFGTSKFASIIFDTLIDEADVKVVVTQPDKPVGRKKELTPPPVKQSLIDNNTNIPILQFEDLKDEAVYEELKSINADIFIVAAYGKIIPNEILEIPKFKSVNVHGSILPKYRGASPIQEALKNGDSETGNTIMLMDEKMDHGPILAQSIVLIDENDNFTTLESKLAHDGAKLLINTLQKYINEKITPQIQDESKATYTNLIKKQDGFVNFNSMSAKEIYNKYRAYSEWPGVSAELNSVKVKLNKIKIAKTIDDGVLVYETKEGFIEILELTPQGKKPMNAKSFVNGYLKKS